MKKCVFRTLLVAILCLGCLGCFVFVPVNTFAADVTYGRVYDLSRQTYILQADGNLWSWGYNGRDDVNSMVESKPEKIMDGVSSVSGAINYQFAIKTDGTLWGWGHNSEGVLCNANVGETITNPVKLLDDVAWVPGMDIDIPPVGLAIKTDGSLWGWGGRVLRDLGYSGETIYTPQRILDNVAEVYPFQTNFVALKTDGTVWTWGYKEGIGFGDGTTDESKNKPVQILNDVVSVYPDPRFQAGAYALKRDGSLWAWGSGSLDSRISRGHIPVKVLDDVSSVLRSNLGATNFVLKTDGSLWVLGLAIPTPVKIMDDVKTVKESHVIKNDDTLWKLNFPNGGTEVVPVKVMDDVADVIYDYYMNPTYTSVLKNDGTLWVWGSDSNAILEYEYDGDEQIGIFVEETFPEDYLYEGYEADVYVAMGGYASKRPAYRQINIFRPEPVKILDNVARCVGNNGSEFVITEDGSLYTWGRRVRIYYYYKWTHSQAPRFYRPVKIMDGMIGTTTDASAASPSPAHAAPSPVAVIPSSTGAPSPWAAEDVNAAVDAGLVPPALQSQYAEPATRAEFAALAVALYENVTGGEITGRETFSDTADVNVEKAAAIGVVTGVGGNLFDPDAQLTREQAAVMLNRLADAAGSPLTGHGQGEEFADGTLVSDWANGAVRQVRAAGIMGGIGENLFAPQESYTREQSIVTVMRLCNVISGEVTTTGVNAENTASGSAS